MLRRGWKDVTYTVGNLSHASLVYDPSGNEDPDGDSDGTSIRIANRM